MQTEQELEKLVHAHTGELLRYCTGLLGCEADAQDAVQKTFIKAWQRRHTLRHDGTDNERAWLYRIAYRTALVLERVLEGLDYAALARIHGRPAGYLRTRYHRAKKQLATLLKEGEHDEV